MDADNVLRKLDPMRQKVKTLHTFISVENVEEIPPLAFILIPRKTDNGIQSNVEMFVRLNALPAELRQRVEEMCKAMGKWEEAPK